MIRRFGRLAYPSEVAARGTVVARIPTSDEVDALQSVLWTPNVPRALDQGAVGSCTGNAVAQCLSTQPFGLTLTEDDAVRCYTRATQLDAIPGEYPDVDTGSTGWAAMTAALEFGWIKGFSRADNLYQILLALQTRPCILGSDWYRGDDDPDAYGLTRPTGVIRGGHEPMVAGCELVRDEKTNVLYLDASCLVLRNSWNGWGVTIAGATGYFRWPLNHVAARLATGGDCHVPDVP